MIEYTKAKTITARITFNERDFDLEKVTPEYVLSVLIRKGLEVKGVTITVDKEMIIT